MAGRSHQSAILLIIAAAYLLLLPVCLGAQQKPPGPPPANVTVVRVESGLVAPQAEFIATVFYQEISDTAAEINGLVESVSFEEGQRVAEKQVLVELDSELLRKRRQAAVSLYEQILAELEIAKIDLKRKKSLYRKKSISEQSFDETRFQAIGLEKRAAALKAQVEQLEIELKKKTIRAPFNGVVIHRRVDRGEWISEGETVAVIGKDDIIDIIADVPERYIRYVEQDMPVNATINGNRLRGNVIAVVPRGYVATRTFPVKIRTANQYALIEGMSARVILPTADSVRALIVPRDAVIRKFGQTVVFAASDSKARMIPVTVVGYSGLNAGVESADLKPGMLIVLEGVERLRDKQAIEFGSVNAEVGVTWQWLPVEQE